MLTDFIGWTSSAILVLTIGQQVWKQWNDRSSKGVSRWLFVGQLAASAGFTTYSLLKRDWVFVITNTVMVANASLGFLVLRRNKRHTDRESEEHPSGTG